MKRIGILTFHNACNFGAVLQAYALKKTVAALCEAQVDILDYRNPQIKAGASVWGQFRCARNKGKELVRTALCLPYRICRNWLFVRFRAKRLEMTGRAVRRSELRKCNYDILITGSDQVWNLELTGGDATYFLDFADENKVCCAYGASIGQSIFTDEEKTRLTSLMQKMDAISFREEELVPFFSAQLPEKEIASVLDPVFLLPVERWRAMQPTMHRKPYVLFFAVGNSPELLPAIEFAVRLAKERGVEALFLSDQDIWYKFRMLKHYGPASPETFLALIDHADCVVTNSFHATSFAIQFHKEVFVETGMKRNGRLVNLLRLTGMEDRAMIRGKVSSQGLFAIDWEYADAALAAKREKSIRFIQKYFKQ